MNKAVLFSDFTIITSHDNGEVSVLEHAYCVVFKDKIHYVGLSNEEATDVASELSEDEIEVYDGKNKILCPTFANAHAHMPMSIFRNIADDYALNDWLFGEIIPREDKMIAEDFQYGHLLSIAEMIESGTACAANMYDGAKITTKASVEAGFRVQQTIMGKKCVDGEWSTDSEDVDEFLSFCESLNSDLITKSLLVHSIYLYPEHLYPSLAELAKKYALPVSVHISETLTEIENCSKQYGCSPVEKLNEAGLLSDTTVAAHCVHLNDADRAILTEKGVWVVHNPSSNMKLASGFADMQAMEKVNIRLCLGTDGAASNNNQDMFLEMRLAAFMAKGSTLDPTVLPASRVFHMATRNGYLASGFPECGIIEAGMKADMQIIDYDCPQMWPLGNPVSALVYSCGPKCVESVMINGKFVLYKHELTTLDKEKIFFQTKKTMERLK